MTTAVEEDTNTCVDTAQGGSEGKGEGGVTMLEGREAVGIPERGCAGAARGGEGSEEGRGREGVVVAMSTSSEGERGLVGGVVDRGS